VEFIRTGRKLATEVMRQVRRHRFGVLAEERQTANVVVVLSSDEKTGNGAASLLQEVQEIGTAWRVVTGQEICDCPRQLVGEDECCGDASSFALAGIGTRWSGGTDREFNA
jgi:hypothetical protein